MQEQVQRVMAARRVVEDRRGQPPGQQPKRAEIQAAGKVVVKEQQQRLVQLARDREQDEIVLDEVGAQGRRVTEDCEQADQRQQGLVPVPGPEGRGAAGRHECGHCGISPGKGGGL
jgi:hypothetical protein